MYFNCAPDNTLILVLWLLPPLLYIDNDDYYQMYDKYMKLKKVNNGLYYTYWNCKTSSFYYNKHILSIPVIHK